MGRAGMEYGVEIRVPWLDLDLVRWSLMLPDDVLSAEGGKGPAKILCRRVLPTVVAERAKRGFTAPVERARRGSALRSRAHADFVRDTTSPTQWAG